MGEISGNPTTLNTNQKTTKNLFWNRTIRRESRQKPVEKQATTVKTHETTHVKIKKRPHQAKPSRAPGRGTPSRGLPARVPPKSPRSGVAVFWCGSAAYWNGRLGVRYLFEGLKWIVVVTSARTDHPKKTILGKWN